MDDLFSAATLAATLRIATPLLLAALGGLLCERSGVINIALEGILLNGAFAAVAGAWLARASGLPPGAALAAGLAAALAAGFLTSVLHGLVCIRFGADQIVSGLAINLLAVGATRFACQALFGSPSNSPEVAPLASAAPVLVAFGLIGVPAAHVFLFHTPWGLRLQAAGEHPEAALTLGVRVARLRWLAVSLSGLLGGLAGASLAAGVQRFVPEMSGGRGYIALAAVIFGRWTPAGALAAALLFGWAEAAAPILRARAALPHQLAQTLPYLLTLVALAGFAGRARPPAALGKPRSA